MGLLAHKPGSLLGLDIGTTAVKLIELSRSGAGYRVEACGVEPLPAPAVAAHDGDNISDAGAIGDAIRHLAKRAGTKTRAAAVAVPGSAATVRTVAMDASLTDAEMELEVAEAAERHIPYSAAEAALDFEPQNLSLDNPAAVDVVIAACPLRHVLSLEAAVAGGGLRAAVVDVETFCLQRAARACGADAEPLVLVDIGAATIKLLALHGAEVVFSRQEAFDGARWRREELADRPAALASFHDDLLRLLAQLLRLYASAGDRAAALGSPALRGAAAQMLIAGGAANPSLAAMVADRLGTPAQLADPFAGMALGSRVDAATLRDNAPALMTACGLALRRFDP